MIVQENIVDYDYKYVYLIDNTDKINAFEELETGDRIEIKYGIIKIIDDKMTAEVFDYFLIYQ